MLAIAAELARSRLPADRPLWRLTIVSDLRDGRTGLVIVFHHVLADGIGGLAVLANLVDGAPPEATDHFPTPTPSSADLARSAASGRLAALATLRGSTRRIREALAQLRPAVGRHAQRCSLNSATGPRRQLAVVHADLESIRRIAHEHAATVNDVALTVVTGGLHRLLLARGESIDRFVISVPMSARGSASATELGNRVGVIPIDLPATGEPLSRLTTIADATRAAKRTAPAASTAVLGPFFRLLAFLGILRWFIDRQRSVHTFVTNVRGPDTQLSFLGSTIVDLIPIAMITGNVTVSFAVLSYAGALNITVIADPDACPDLPALRQTLDDELRRLGTATGWPSSAGPSATAEGPSALVVT
ncbi:MAG: hypothetical protein JWN46_1350 [Acidimicrobiales bacterium]|nr:hypothetical protein [Acidimicrobiales bacterium]